MNPNIIDEINAMSVSNLLSLQTALKIAVKAIKDQQDLITSKQVKTYLDAKIEELDRLLAEVDNSLEYGDPANTDPDCDIEIYC